MLVRATALHRDLDASVLDRAGKMTDCRECDRRKCREPPRFVGVTDRADHAAVTPMAGVEHRAQGFIVAEVAVGFVKQQRRTRRLNCAEQRGGGDIICGEGTRNEP